MPSRRRRQKGFEDWIELMARRPGFGIRAGVGSSSLGTPILAGTEYPLGADIFGGFTNPHARQFLNPRGQAVSNELSMLLGLDAPVASYNLAAGKAPHVQTSPGVYESAYRVAGLPDPNFDQPVNNQPPVNSQQAANVPLANPYFSLHG